MEGGDNVAMRLKAARVNAGMTQADVILAYNERYGQKLAQSTLVSWEQEKTFPTVPQFKALCAIYGVEMNDIFVPEMLT